MSPQDYGLDHSNLDQHSLSHLLLPLQGSFLLSELLPEPAPSACTADSAFSIVSLKVFQLNPALNSEAVAAVLVIEKLKKRKQTPQD